jgi:hypothetical protein
LDNHFSQILSFVLLLLSWLALPPNLFAFPLVSALFYHTRSLRERGHRCRLICVAATTSSIPSPLGSATRTLEPLRFSFNFQKSIPVFIVQLPLLPSRFHSHLAAAARTREPLRFSFNLEKKSSSVFIVLYRVPSIYHLYSFNLPEVSHNLVSIACSHFWKTSKTFLIIAFFIRFAYWNFLLKTCVEGIVPVTGFYHDCSWLSPTVVQNFIVNDLF